jgi:integrase
MVHKQKRGRSYVLDRQFKGVGRIKRASGTDDPRMFKLLDGMVGTLYKAGRVDILQAVQRGKLTLLEVWSRYRLGELDRLPTVETMRPLKAEMEAWVENADTGTWNRQSRRYGVRAILRLAKKDATVQDLPDLLRAYANTARGATMFNRARSAAQAFIRDTIGKSHPLYARARDVRAKRIRTREGNPQTPQQLTVLTEKLHPAFAEIAWSMALTGMLPGELWGNWTQYRDRIHIHGTKRKGRKRDIPFVRSITKPSRKYRPFLEALGEASGQTVLPKDLRNTFANWMESAQVPRTRRKLYMGHGSTDVTDIYERHEVTQFLLADGARIRGFLEENGVLVPPQLSLVKTVSA